MLGKRLELLRKEKNLTQEQLGKILGFRDSTISQYESGKRNPDIETASRLANFFNVSLDFLVGRNETRQLESQQNNPSSSLHRKIDQLPDEKQKVIETIIDSFLREAEPPHNDEQAATAGK